MRAGPRASVRAALHDERFSGGSLRSAVGVVGRSSARCGLLVCPTEHLGRERKPSCRSGTRIQVLRPR